MPAPFPHHYEANLDWTEGSQGNISAPSLPEIIGGPPPQFDGKDGVWSPEQLLLSAAGLCLMTTFLALAKKSPLDLSAYQSRAQGTLDRTKEGLVFTDITLHVKITVPAGNVERAEKLIETAKKYCIVSNSLKRPINLDASVVAA